MESKHKSDALCFYLTLMQADYLGPHKIPPLALISESHLLFSFISPNTQESVLILVEKGVGMLYCEGPACGSRVWLMRLIVKGCPWIRKHCHYCVCLNIPHGFGVWFLFNAEQWLLYEPFFFHASLTITVVSEKTETGPAIRDTSAVLL